MRASYRVYLVSLLAALVIVQGNPRVTYTVTNKASHTIGGNRFNSKFHVTYAKAIMELATKHILRIFGQDASSSDREQVEQIDLFIDEMEGTSTSELKNHIGQIHISANHIASCGDDYMKEDFSDLIYYELTHILQWKANGQVPPKIKDGIASYIVLCMNEENPRGWVKFGGGDKWNQSHDVTAHFFQFCDYELCGGFVGKFNKMMKHSYDDKYFSKLTGKTIEVAWKQYKGKYGNKPS